LDVAGIHLLPQTIKLPSQVIVSRGLELAITARGRNVTRTKIGDMFTSMCAGTTDEQGTKSEINL
jgi:hypothetical protein